MARVKLANPSYQSQRICMSTVTPPKHLPLTDFIAPVCETLVEALYQDNDIMLINKPSGLLSVSGTRDFVYYRL